MALEVSTIEGKTLLTGSYQGTPSQAAEKRVICIRAPL
jgi:hypothetical protein